MKDVKRVVQGGLGEFVLDGASWSGRKEIGWYPLDIDLITMSRPIIREESSEKYYANTWSPPPTGLLLPNPREAEKGLGAALHRFR